MSGDALDLSGFTPRSDAPPERLSASLILLAVSSILFGLLGVVSTFWAYGSPLGGTLFADPLNETQQAKLLSAVASLVQFPDQLGSENLDATLERLPQETRAEFHHYLNNPETGPILNSLVGSLRMRLMSLAPAKREALLHYLLAPQASADLREFFSAWRMLMWSGVVQGVFNALFVIGGFALLARREWGRKMLIAALLGLPLAMALFILVVLPGLVATVHGIASLLGLTNAQTAAAWQWSALKSFGAFALIGFLLEALVAWYLMSPAVKRVFLPSPRR